LVRKDNRALTARTNLFRLSSPRRLDKILQHILLVCLHERSHEWVRQ
jgi:hypothetical protein